ncbi:MAG: PP2C family protein-serine/threonine phosphatase, partial [Nocardioides sp.]
LGSLFLGPRTLPWFVIYDMVLLTVALSQQDITGRIVIAVSVQFLMGLVVLLTGIRRASLGVAGTRGESMLVDLRDRILTHGGIPDLPAEWDVQSALHSAGGTAFAGDFVVAATIGTGADARLEVVVVDVSGKGEAAGTRALLLSGAFGGLLGALPPARFLPAANDYLLRQDWDEGFATAIHLSLELGNGHYEIRAAGHPPAAHRASGSGRWQVLRTEGPVLGLIEDAEFTCATGDLNHGDAVLLYTDGMVEEPRRDIDLGIDRMLGEAEALLRGSFDDAAELLTESLGSRNDDRAMLVVHRR